MRQFLLLMLIINVFFFSCSSPDKTENSTAAYTPSVPPAGWPDRTNTGLTNPSILTASSDLTVTTNGAVVENLEINGQLTIDADNVTIRNNRIWGSYYYAVLLKSGSNLIIENNEIGKDSDNWPNHMKANTIKDDNPISVIISKNYIRYTDDGIYVGFLNGVNNITFTIEDNYIVYIHADDGIPGDSIADHKGDGIEIQGMVINSTVRHNSINVPDSQTSCILFQAHYGDLDGITIDNNWLDGAGYSLKARVREFNFTNLTVTDNRFGRNYFYGIWDSDLDLITPNTISGNVWDDTGQPAF